MWKEKIEFIIKNLKIRRELSLAAEVKSDFNFGGFEDSGL